MISRNDDRLPQVKTDELGIVLFVVVHGHRPDIGHGYAQEQGPIRQVFISG